MNPEQLLNEAALAIEKRGVCITGYYHVCFLDGKIQCISPNNPIEVNCVFETYPARDLEHGLTTRQWDELSANIVMFYKKEALKCQDQKQ